MEDAYLLQWLLHPSKGKMTSVAAKMKEKCILDG